MKIVEQIFRKPYHFKARYFSTLPLYEEFYSTSAPFLTVDAAWGCKIFKSHIIHWKIFLRGSLHTRFIANRIPYALILFVLHFIASSNHLPHVCHKVFFSLNGKVFKGFDYCVFISALYFFLFDFILAFSIMVSLLFTDQILIQQQEFSSSSRIKYCDFVKVIWTGNVEANRLGIFKKVVSPGS